MRTTLSIVSERSMPGAYPNRGARSSHGARAKSRIERRRRPLRGGWGLPNGWGGAPRLRWREQRHATAAIGTVRRRIDRDHELALVHGDGHLAIGHDRRR